jgi:GNAT superfamily N-acetyltransferase
MGSMKISRLDAKSAPEFRHFTMPRYFRYMVAWDEIHGELIAFGLYDEDKPAGLILVHYYSEEIPARLLSIFVEERYRNQKNASKLLDSALSVCREIGVQTVEALALANSNMEILDRLFRKFDFEPPVKNAYYCKVGQGISQHPMLKELHFPADFEVVPWKELTDFVKEDLHEELMNKGWCPVYLSPFKSNLRIEPETSMALLKDGMIYGWILNEITAPDTITYSSFMVHPEIRSQGHGIAMLMNSIDRHVNSDLAKQFKYGMFKIRYENKSWLMNAKKIFKPYAVAEVDRVCWRHNQ